MRVWLAWNSVILYNLWVLMNLEMLEEKGIPQDYQCCNVDIKELKRLRMEEGEKRKQLIAESKLSAKKRARKQKENPLITWKPKPQFRFWEFCLQLEELAHLMIQLIYLEGYDPPDDMDDMDEMDTETGE
jgi:hypothetical protein